MARDRLTQYYWFCLEHVRDYNKAWDYFKGMNEAQIEAQRRHDTVWQRPSWPLGGGFVGARADARLHDDFGLFGDPAHRSVRAQSEEEKALAILDLERPSDFTQIKARYKKLAKQLHPDANGGNKEAEERLKFVNQAYTTLKSSFAG